MKSKAFKKELQGASSIADVFRIAFVRAVHGLDSGDVAALLRVTTGDLPTLAWVPADFIAALEALFLDLVGREKHRHRVRDPERGRLLRILDTATQPEGPRTMFAVAYLLDQAYHRWPPPDHGLPRGVAVVPARFFAEIKNEAPPIGQMTPMAACRRWMSTFWFIGDLARLDAFGPTPTLDQRALSARASQSLQRACEDDELRVAVVAHRNHVATDLVTSAKARLHTFAVTGLKTPSSDGLISRIVDALHVARVHVAVFPEISLDAAELALLRATLAQRARRFPCLLAAGLAHREKTGDGFLNEAVVLDSSGAELLRHEKLEPYGDPKLGLEDILPRNSTQYSFIDTPVGRLVVNICRDVRSDLPMVLNRMIGTSLLLVPAYSSRLDFALDEARGLGARQQAISVVANGHVRVDPAPANVAAVEAKVAAVYAPVRGKDESEFSLARVKVAEYEAAVQVVRLTRIGGAGLLAAEPLVPV